MLEHFHAADLRQIQVEQDHAGAGRGGGVLVFALVVEVVERFLTVSHHD
ncbi:MAG: hypothetical protein MPW14_19810 [Candidatus Manganitrophus sp.]|nr:MAG: hypothetical protein MPW14_19810 [Candidatus Manganitrophus sp.]